MVHCSSYFSKPIGDFKVRNIFFSFDQPIKRQRKENIWAHQKILCSEEKLEQNNQSCPLKSNEIRYHEVPVPLQTTRI